MRLLALTLLGALGCTGAHELDAGVDAGWRRDAGAPDAGPAPDADCEGRAPPTPGPCNDADCAAGEVCVGGSCVEDCGGWGALEIDNAGVRGSTCIPGDAYSVFSTSGGDIDAFSLWVRALTGEQRADGYHYEVASLYNGGRAPDPLRPEGIIHTGVIPAGRAPTDLDAVGLLVPHYGGRGTVWLRLADSGDPGTGWLQSWSESGETTERIPGLGGVTWEHVHARGLGPSSQTGVYRRRTGEPQRLILAHDGVPGGVAFRGPLVVGLRTPSGPRVAYILDRSPDAWSSTSILADRSDVIWLDGLGPEVAIINREVFAWSRETALVRLVPTVCEAPEPFIGLAPFVMVEPIDGRQVVMGVPGSRAISVDMDGDGRGEGLLWFY